MRRLRRARARDERVGRRSAGLRILTAATCLVAGLMIATSAVNAKDGDLRPNRNTDLIRLVQEQADHNAQLSRRLSELRAETRELAGSQSVAGPTQAQLAAAAAAAGTRPVRGPAVRVTLTDAPTDATPQGVNESLLVVHQQDIEAVVDALWRGGAEAMTIQGQRVTSRTGIKCVGNTVVLHGVPYAPPYVIEAIGDQVRLDGALQASAPLMVFRQYADAYRLGYRVQRVREAAMPAYAGSVDARRAAAKR